jgi:hypothetical protein
MDQVKVAKDHVYCIVEENRKKHRAEFEKALEGWKSACILVLESNLEALRSGRAQRVFINEPPPEDHTRDYDRVLRMLEMSVEDEVVLPAQSFEQFVLDEWGWKEAWAATTSKYLKG